MKLFPVLMKRLYFSKIYLLLFLCFAAQHAFAQNIIRQGFNAINVREYGIAYKNFTEAVKTLPDSATAYYGLGLMEEYYQLDTNKALQYFDVATKLNPGYALAFKELARIKYKKRNYYSALTYSNQAIVSDPNNAGAYNIRGKTYKAMGSYDEAVYDFNKAIDLSPNFAEAYLYRGIAEKALKQYDYAMSDISRSVELQPAYYSYYFDDGENSPELMHVNDTIRIQMERRAYNMYYVPVNIDGVKEWFVLDFGCDGINIPQRMNEEIQRKGTLDNDQDFLKNSQKYDITTKNYDVKMVSIKTLRLGNQIMFNVPVSVSPSNNAMPLLGMEVFRRFGKVIIDNQTFMLTLIRYKNNSYSGNSRNKNKYYTQPADNTSTFVNARDMPITVKQNKCMMKVEINGEPTDMIFDTGAASFCVSEDFINYLKLQGKISDADYVNDTRTTGASGTSVTGSFIHLKSVKLGGKVLTDVNSLVIHTEYNGLLLGEAVLQKFNKITVDFSYNQISFE